MIPGKIGVIGAGTMGISVTVDLILHHIPVVLVDQNEEALRKAREDIRNTVRFVSFAQPSLPGLAVEEMEELILFSTELQNVEHCQFIIENIIEDVVSKREVYLKIDQYCDAGVIFGVNTSCIPISQIASFTSRPQQVIGIHLMNPVYMKSAVEIILGQQTSSETLEAVEELLTLLGKEALVINDRAGFVTNRVSHLFMNEAAFLVYEGVAKPKKVDEIFKKCYGHPMGPLETADLIGIDTVVHSLKILYDYYQDSKFRCCPLLKQMVYAGQLGKKTGQGFYCYSF